MEKTEKEIKAKKKRISDKQKDIEKLFSEIEDSKKLKLAKGLIAETAYLNAELEDLKVYIIENGIKEEYKNGANQFGFKDSVEVKTYIALSKQYLSNIKQLNDMIPTEVPISIDDAFDNFGGDM